jgi:methylenetetrahydrofolate dehydrogenase (NADP+)/methenyltetrahydrofolate cyclohydrolase
MPAELMLGQNVVDAMRSAMADEGLKTGVGILQVGRRPESESYIMQVRRTIASVPGMSLDHRALPKECTLDDLHAAMDAMNEDDAVSGYMLQLPLSPALQAQMQRVREWIAPDKDIDLLGYEQSGVLLYGKQREQLVPPTPYAVLKLLDFYRVEKKGKMMAIVGDGEVGGRLKVMAGHDKVNQIVLNETVANLDHWTRQADIVVAAAGVPGIIHGGNICEGAVVVNVGVRFKDGKLQGDVDVNSVMEKASMVTPRIGGLGPVTVMALLQNAVRAARRKSAA